MQPILVVIALSGGRIDPSGAPSATVGALFSTLRAASATLRASSATICSSSATARVNSVDFMARAECISSRPGNRTSWISQTTAIEMAIDSESSDDCPMSTCSFGCTGTLEPTLPPRIWIARLLMTSLTHMFV